MASDNVSLPALSGLVATDSVAVNGGTEAQVQYMKLVDGTANGTTGIPGDSTNGLAVNDSRKFASTATLTNVNDTNSSTSLLASAATRKGATVFNDSTEILYLKYGTTASFTSYTVQIAAGGYWEMPYPIYTGAIDGIWAANGSGAARITELT